MEKQRERKTNVMERDKLRGREKGKGSERQVDKHIDR